MKVIWTLKALKTYFQISDYLKKEWGDTVVIDFTIEVDNVITKIKKNPNMFSSSKRLKSIRKGLITKHNTMFYRVKPNQNIIEILLFWDNRRDNLKRPY